MRTFVAILRYTAAVLIVVSAVGVAYYMGVVSRELRQTNELLANLQAQGMPVHGTVSATVGASQSLPVAVQITAPVGIQIPGTVGVQMTAPVAVQGTAGNTPDPNTQPIRTRVCDQIGPC